MKVFGYMGWETNCREWACPPSCIGCEAHHPLNGNDMVLAINAMRDKGAWNDFKNFVFDARLKEKILNVDVWLFGNPQKFFELMEVWREEVENEKAD